MIPLENDEQGPKINRPSLKTPVSFNNHPSWKQKLRENCFKWVREDRNRLLWKCRLPEENKDRFLKNNNNEDNIKSTFQGIVSDELRKFKVLDESPDLGTVVTDDLIWEHDGLHTAYQGDCEEILVEMHRIFYVDLRTEETTQDKLHYQVGNSLFSKRCTRTWEDEEDEYLSRLVYEHMQLSCEKVIWCPICKQGKSQEIGQRISCNQCELRLDRNDEVNLDLLQESLGEAHAEHLERGCRLRPEFCMETKFELTALYIKCRACNTFEVVL